MNSKANHIRPAVITFVILLAAVQLFAQAGPISSEATVTLAPALTAIAPNASVDVPVRVDLTGITGTNGNATVPAVLGGYQVEVTFDNSRLRLEGVNGGTALGFQGAPTFTNLEMANSRGRVILAAAQATGNGPTGLTHIATLKFVARSGGTAALSVKPASLSTARLGEAGPVGIAGKGSAISLTVTQASGRNRAVGK